jgi:transitional endoplasmic reticulum ATPase
MKRRKQLPTPEDIKAVLSALLKDETVHVAEVVRHGEKIILPKGMSTQTGIDTLTRQLKYDNEVVQMVFDFDYFVWDGAYALSQVMQKRYGFVFGKTEHGFFGSTPPSLVGIEVNKGETVQVPWGQFTAPSIKDAIFTCSFQMKDGKLNFRFIVKCKHMYETEIKKLRDEVELYLREHSIYKGKAISIRFTTDDGKELISNGAIPTPKFLDLSKAVEEDLIFSKKVDDAIKTNLFTILERPDLARKAGIPIKRGILLAGDYGVGKTLTAYVAAQKAIKSGFTYLYCEKPEEFSSVMRFAAQYAPALVFCEDVDRIAPLKRDKAVDELINIIDGVETKNTEIVTVFTTNLIKDVNPSLLRPGRMDAVIPVYRPDAEAVERLVWSYCGQFLPKNADLTQVGELLADNIPSVIREVCERSKLSALRLLPKGQELKTIPVPALVESATTMKMQLDLLSNRSVAPKKDRVIAVEKVAQAIDQLAIAVALSNKVELPKPTPIKINKEHAKELADISVNS